MSEIDIECDQQSGFDDNDPYATLTQIMEHITLTLTTQQAQITALTRQIHNMRAAYSDDIGEIRKPAVDHVTARALLDLRCVMMQSLDLIKAKHSADIAAIRTEHLAQQKSTAARLDTLERETRGMFAEYIKRRASQQADGF